MSHELDSQRFLRQMSHGGAEAVQGANPGDPSKLKASSTEFVMEVKDGTLMRNFEWERRQGNFNPQEFGTEMNQMLGQKAQV